MPLSTVQYPGLAPNAGSAKFENPSLDHDGLGDFSSFSLYQFSKFSEMIFNQKLVIKEALLFNMNWNKEAVALRSDLATARCFGQLVFVPWGTSLVPCGTSAHTFRSEHLAA